MLLLLGKDYIDMLAETFEEQFVLEAVGENKGIDVVQEINKVAVFIWK